MLPADLPGNPEAQFDVVQLPTGEILSVELRKSSGVRSYDEAVHRAILKSSPLPRPDRPELGARLTESFCSIDPRVASQFARVTFLSDNRRDLELVTVPTLVLQCSDDVIAPTTVGRYVHEHIPGSRFVQLAATGHCPNVSAPDEVADEIRAFLR